ncbi:MAG: 30S ribosomal protein S8 [Proteobacteria bacterium]|nr:30S ribosomal protein S8 [Pseudomonadota bacterium]
MITDPIADVLTRIRNAQLARHRIVSVRGSRMVGCILDVLKKEGFIESFKARSEEGRPGTTFEVQLRYGPNGEPTISDARRVSTPGRRVYANLVGLPKVNRGLGIAVLSTSKGVMSDREARKLKVGGEILARVG